jgi:hypothetical protein
MVFITIVTGANLNQQTYLGGLMFPTKVDGKPLSFWKIYYRLAGAAAV